MELQLIHSRDDLPLHAHQLQELFNALADIIVRAEEYKRQHSNAESTPISVKEQAVSEELRRQLNRILRMDGGREVIEKAQENALKKLEKL